MKNTPNVEELLVKLLEEEKDNLPESAFQNLAYQYKITQKVAPIREEIQRQRLATINLNNKLPFLNAANEFNIICIISNALNDTTVKHLKLQGNNITLEGPKPYHLKSWIGRALVAVGSVLAWTQSSYLSTVALLGIGVILETKKISGNGNVPYINMANFGLDQIDLSGNPITPEREASLQDAYGLMKPSRTFITSNVSNPSNVRPEDASIPSTRLSTKLRSI